MWWGRNSSSVIVPFHPSLYLSEPDSSYAESIRSLRANIVPLIQRGIKAYLVTSSWEGEGKSTVCINLAVALSEFGLKVLLLDGDLRQRSLTRLLACADTGISPTGLCQPPLLPGVWLFCSSLPEGERPADFLARSGYLDALRPVLSEFDVVLVDSPPLSVCSDAHLLGRLTDGALLVASRDKFRGLPEGHYSEDLRDHGINILGVVITGI